ncbi:PKD domain-containing protein [Methanogenium sp. MK-MG]|uniref:PKD domain-containing protein n=1 Tax=Methanogenium sp. MK-MG TaxID=2599926 RepID=UPI0013ED281C|nr:PKD domain-containing protein [Methanogenium sp. MK-MG]
MIGSIILIGVFVAAFGVILVMLLSAPSEFIVPAVVIEADVIVEDDQYVLNLRSGDTLQRNETRILVDGIDRTGDFTSVTGASDWDQWRSGDSLTLDLAGNERPDAVQIIYSDSDGDGILLWDVGTSVTVIPPTGLTPLAAFSANVTNGLSPLSVQFTDLSSNDPNSWQWSFGDGETSSQQNPVHIYTSSGVYTVQLTAHNPDGSGTVVKSDLIHVSDGFVVDFVATPLSGTVPLMVSFTDLTTGTPVSWLWNFGDGSTSTQQNPSHTYLSGGSYTVTLNASDGILSQTEEKTGYINVTEICLPGLYGTYFDEFNDEYQVPFSGNSVNRIDQRIWFADSDSGEESDEADWPVATLGKANKFSVVYEGFLIVPENETYTFYLESDDGSVLWIDDVADGDPVVIDNWGTDGTHPPREESVSLSLTKGKHPIRIKMTEYYGGAVLHLAWESATIPRQEVESFCYVPGGLQSADFTATPLSGASPMQVEFTDLSIGNISSWEWDFGDGSTSTEQNPVHTYLSAGLYTVTLVVSDGIISYSEEKSEYIYVTDGCLPGLYGTYYDDYNSVYSVPFSGDSATRTDMRIWFADTASGEESDEINWPVATIGKAEHFGVVYEGFLIVPKDETYTFHLRSDDGSVLWIDNIADTDPVVIDNWGLHSATTESTSLFLTKGKHPIRIKMTENNGKAVLHLEWESATIPRQVVESFCYGSGSSLIAGFEGAPRSGDRPLAVQFTDLSSGNVSSWAWDFGDGGTSAEANPLHRYESSGLYSVSLTVSNAAGVDTFERTDYIEVTDNSFAEYVVSENVFVYGQQLNFAGDSISGSGATIHITGDALNTNDLNGGASLNVSNIYVDGSINLNGGSAGLGSETSPGLIYVNGDFTLGNGRRNVYGDVYVNGDCFLKDPVIHGNVSVNGDLELDWTPDFTHARIYYMGTFKYPNSLDPSILNKCVKVDSVPGFVIPDYDMPPVKSDTWYSSRGYVSGGYLADDMKIFADSYASSSWRPSAENVVLVAKAGDITLTGLGGSGVTGVLFAPNGKVVFSGGFFEGVVIAKDGFFVTSGGTDVTFKNMDEYISDPADFPF